MEGGEGRPGLARGPALLGAVVLQGVPGGVVEEKVREEEVMEEVEEEVEVKEGVE